jgi:hypothetical protein
MIDSPNFFNEMHGRGKKPSRKYTCPDCKVEFIAAGTSKRGRQGKTCPNGHWNAMYVIAHYQKHGSKPTPRTKAIPSEVQPPAPQPATTTAASGEQAPRQKAVEQFNFLTKSDQSDLLALLWMEAYERLIQQLPQSTSRLLVEGAFGLAYKATAQALRPPVARPIKRAA